MMPLLRAVVLAAALASAALLHPSEVRAQQPGLVPEICREEPCPVTGIAVVGQNIQLWLVITGGSVAVLAVIIAGVRYIGAAFAGDSGAIGEAKKRLTFAIIGVVVLLLAYVLIVTIFRALGRTNLPTFP